jgi:hypothetical protein
MATGPVECHPRWWAHAYGDGASESHPEKAILQSIELERFLKLDFPLRKPKKTTCSG